MLLTPDNKLKKLIVIGDRIFDKTTTTGSAYSIRTIPAAGCTGKRKSSAGICDQNRTRLCDSPACGKRDMEK